MENDLLDFLHFHTFFRELPKVKLMEILSPAKRLLLPKGEYLVRAKEEKRDFYLVINGRLRFLMEGQNIREISEPDFIGETVILTKEKWPFDIIAARDTSLLIIPEKLFLSLFEKFPQIFHQILRKLAVDIEDTLTQKKNFSPPKRIAFLSIHSSPNELSFVKDFVTLLETHESVFHLHDLKHLPSPQKEGSVRWVVLDGDISFLPSISSSFDRIFLISNGEAPLLLPEIPPTENVELLLLREEKKEHSFPRIQTRLVRKNKKEDLERLFRSISGKSIGIVLGSGGAKTAAQLGILSALEENHVPIDIIGGTGLGALIGALYAQGRPVQNIQRILKHFYQNVTHYLDFTFPFLSLAKGGRMQRMLESLFDSLLIEDLLIPYFCISSQLNFHDPFVHKKGLLWKSIRASLSVPGILPPVFWEDKLLVDGSLTNALPTDIMQDFEPGKIIAIDTDTHREWSSPRRFAPFLSGWQYLIPFLRPKVPNILQTLFASTFLGSNLKKKELLEQSPPNLLITPPLKEFSSFEFSAFDRLFQAGRQYAQEHMDEWKKKLEI